MSVLVSIIIMGADGRAPTTEMATRMVLLMVIDIRMRDFEAGEHICSSAITITG